MEEVQRQRNLLRIVAPVSGRVVARKLNDKIDTYVPQGTELLAVGDDGRKELHISVSHEQIDQVAHRLGCPVRLRTGLSTVFEGTLLRVDPRATRRLTHPALSAAVGGPLALGEVVAANGQPDFQLIEPRFAGVIAVTPEIAGRLACGDRGYAVFGLRGGSIANQVWGRFHRWFPRQLGPGKTQKRP
jgi:putative peptide zinc metalloprotease protein